jgi:hypothetical protein
MTRGADVSATWRAREQAGLIAGPSGGKRAAREGERGHAVGPRCWAEPREEKGSSPRWILFFLFKKCKIVFSFVYFVVNYL